MKNFNLGMWTVQVDIIGDISLEKYDFVCDGKRLVILTAMEDFITFVKVGEKNNLILQRIPYYFQYKISHSDKVLTIKILDYIS